MDFQEILSQLERPYWSPTHPSKYVATENVNGRLMSTGWGRVYPDDIGAFNLMWLMSGVGMPPKSYSPYALLIAPVFDASFELVKGRYLKDLAAVLPIERFALAVSNTLNPRIPQVLFDALRLRTV